ncbi:hypothetical protein AB0424_00415 [Streptomyces sp. NPDC051180]
MTTGPSGRWRRAPGLSWTFYRSRAGVRDVSHRHPVIMGYA